MAKRTFQKVSVLMMMSGGMLFANGCLAIGGNLLDQLLSPSASGNALLIPFSPVGGLIQALRFLG